MCIQYTVPGFEPTTLHHESSPITTRPGLPPKVTTVFPIRFERLNENSPIQKGIFV